MTQKKRFWKTRGKCADRLPQPRASYVARHWHNDQPYVCRHRVSHPHVSTTCRGDCVSLGHRLKMSDFSHVRECMTINVFLLIYCRYIHMASKQDCDVLHHISYGVLICGGRDFHGERRVHFLGYLSAHAHPHYQSCLYLLRRFTLLFHVRRLEEIRNTAWSTCGQPGRWISFDEKIVVNKGRFSKVVRRYLPYKLIICGESRGGVIGMEG